MRASRPATGLRARVATWYVTNAVRYGRGGIRLGLTLEDGLLRCEVEDSEAAPPRIRQEDPDDERGQGERPAP